MNPLEMDSFKKLYNNKETDHPTGLLITDKEGNILTCNSFFALTNGEPLEEISKYNITTLVKNRVYNKSTALKAMELKQVVSDIVTTQIGLRVRSISTPIKDSFGEVTIIVTSSHLLDSEDYSVAEKVQVDKIKNEEYNTLQKEVIGNKNVVAESIQMKRILHICNQIALFDSRVLIYGESGTGKDVLSNYIHSISNRKDAPFVSVNCAAIPEALFESELFGHEKGAFTGATVTKQGLFEIANGGTLFLDEISEMPLELQVKLLRVLESQEFRHIGGTETFKSDFRLIAATNRDLSQMVDEGTFRRDLYYRISVIPITIQPLRERKLDIIALANKFIREFNERYHLEFKMGIEQYRYILSNKWPGNVRELKNYIEKIVVIENRYDPQRFDSESELNNYCFITFNQDTDLKHFLATAEKQYITKVLNECDGKVGEASNKLGIHRTALYRKLKMIENEK